MIREKQAIIYEYMTPIPQPKLYDPGISRIYENNILNQNCLIRELQHVTSQFSIESTSKSDSGRFGIFILYTLYFTLFFISGRFHFFHHLPQFYDCFDIWLEWQILFSGCSDCEFESLRFIIWKRSLCLLMAKMFQVRVSGEQSFWQIVLPHPFENLG